ncbi:MAG TPA: hypothetical protein VF432_07935 [Thermoanaerobaculia bacterium]
MSRGHTTQARDVEPNITCADAEAMLADLPERACARARPTHPVVENLEESSTPTPSLVRGGGPKTVAEIAEPVAQAGVEWEAPELEPRVPADASQPAALIDPRARISRPCAGDTHIWNSVRPGL